MRILHNYRNISRATKQFMMGDRFFEQLMILTTLYLPTTSTLFSSLPIKNTTASFRVFMISPLQSALKLTLSSSALLLKRLKLS